MSQYDPTVDLKINVGHWDLYFIIIWDYESVWPEVWPQNKCRSLWRIFHGPVILRYILKTIWCMNIVFWDYGSAWPMFDLKINVGHSDVYFMVQWFCVISWRLFDVWISYFRIMGQNDPIFDLKIHVGHCDLYFMVQWFCLMSWTFWYMNISIWDYESVCPEVWPQNKCRSLWCIFYVPVILPYILKTIWYMNISIWDYESVWPEVWPQNKCRSLRPIFHGPVILPYILKTIWCINIIIWDCESVWPEVWPENKCRPLWRIFHGAVILRYILRLFDVWTSYFGIMGEYDPIFDLKTNVGHCDLCFMVQWFCLVSWRLIDVWTS